MKRGFSLLELVLTIGIAVTLMAAISPFLYSKKTRSDVDLATMSVAQRFRRASLLAAASDSSDSWGVKVVTGQIIVFRGSSYASRVTAQDEITTIDSNLTIGGTSEFVFSRFTGIPVSTGSLTLSSGTGQTKTMTVNAAGMVEYD